jgi:hypothetical protein
MTEGGVLKVARTKNVAAGLRRLDVIVDGQKVGSIGNGEEQTFDVSEGTHSVEVKLGFGSRSEVVDVYVASGSTSELECGISGAFWQRNLAIVAVVLMIVAGGKAFVHSPVGMIIILLAAVFSLVTNYKPGSTYYLRKKDSVTLVH